MPFPIKGLLVLDFTRLLPGPFCTQLLANLGADVIKVEDPALGDYMRAVPPSVVGVSYPFLMVNRGKRSLAVDLKTPEGRKILYKLVLKADLVVEQFRPGVMKKLGADYATLRRKNGRLIFCSFSGYGQTGPSKRWAGHDITFEAHAGVLGVTAGPEGHPAIPGVPIADLASGFNAALAIMAALRTRDSTGTGEFIDVSIFDTAVALMVLNLARYLPTGEQPAAGETLLTGTFPFYNLYESKDGRWLAVAAVEPKFWRRMCELLGARELIDRQFPADDEKHEVVDALRARFRTRNAFEWEALFAKEDLPVVVVRSVGEVVRDPQVRARHLLPTVAVPGLRKVRVIAHPAKHTRTSTRDPNRVPGQGDDTEAILKSLGYSQRRIAALSESGIIRCVS
jgi:alpha-methylacyl-CoA racemase